MQHAVGEVLHTAGRTVDAGDLTAFAGLSGTAYALHVNADVMRASRFGTVIAQGSLVFGLATGLVAAAGWRAEGLDVPTLRVLAPVRPGDTVRVVVTVTAAGWEHVVLDQRGTEVMRFTRVPAQASA